MSKPLVTVITSTTGNPLLSRCVDSVCKQTHPFIQHLLIIDGPDRRDNVTKQFIGPLEEDVIERDTTTSRWEGVAPVKRNYRRNVIQLPYATGKDRYNGHRNLAAGIYVAQGDYVCFLDDDNSMEPTHIEDCLGVIEAGNQWAFSLRNIVDKDHKFLCKDNCESLGLWPSVCGPNDYFVDMNCYFLPKGVALSISPLMHRRFREPGQMEVDRAMVWGLRQFGAKYDTTGKYTINYAVANSQHSVTADFFMKGNEIMNQHYQGKYPWVK